MKALIVHGGAGRILRNPEGSKAGIKDALDKGYEVLTRKHSSVEAVVEAVKAMEDNPVFNCGTGSVLNLMGEVEMDASLMFIPHPGGEAFFGAVGAIKSIKNPILVARKILEETDHLLIVGDGATRFARRMGFELYNPVTEERIKQLEDFKTKGEFGYFQKLSLYLNWETVGAVALDNKGGLAVATSTGGILGKLPGRVGDTAIIGGGTYVTPYGGASATGHGEGIMRLFLTKVSAELMEKNIAEEAIKIAIERATEKNYRCGLIGIDSKGNIGLGYNTDFMAWGWVKEGESKVF